MVVEIVVSVLILLVGIAVLVTIHVCIVGSAFRRDYENGGTTAIVVQRSFISSPSMSPDDIKELPCFDYMVEEEEEEEKGNNGQMECAVCLERFEVGDKCRLLPNCNHRFHSLCIDSWLLKTAACPICRTSASSTRIQDQSCSSSEVGLS